jgi:hypothetical protein
MRQHEFITLVGRGGVLARHSRIVKDERIDMTGEEIIYVLEGSLEYAAGQRRVKDPSACSMRRPWPQQRRRATL